MNYFEVIFYYIVVIGNSFIYNDIDIVIGVIVLEEYLCLI